MRRDDRATARQVATWWHELQPDPERKHPGDRATLARLRHCGSVTEALFEPETQMLAQRCAAQGENAIARMALVAGVVAHVRTDTPAMRLARQIGPVDMKDAATTLCKPIRFRRLLDARTYDECLRGFRRLVVLAGGAVNVTDLAHALLLWPREGTHDDVRAEWIRREWVYQYWNAGPPATDG